jgi:hypothetical protein
MEELAVRLVQASGEAMFTVVVPDTEHPFASETVTVYVVFDVKDGVVGF